MLAMFPLEEKFKSNRHIHHPVYLIIFNLQIGTSNLNQAWGI